ncbi:MAG: DUF4345 family protein [Myxococcales bacterium]|nr:DUF4345 family protein [Myxococcales bacterium]
MSEPDASAEASAVPRAVLLGLAAGYVAVGVAFLLAPAKLAAFADLSTTSKLGLIELRAFYGGIEIGLGVFLAVTAMRKDWQLPGLLAALLSLLGIVAARIYGMTVEGWPGVTVLLFLLIEVAGVVAAGYGLMRIKRGPAEADLEGDIAALRSEGRVEKTKVIEKTAPLERTKPLVERTVRLPQSKDD